MRNKLQYMSCILITSMLIDQGDGRWKERDKENIRRDMLMYKKIADKLEREVKEFYDEYPEGWIEEDNLDLHTYLTDSLSSKLEATDNNQIKNKIPLENHFPVIPNQDFNITSSSIKESELNKISRNLSEYSQPKTDWPKFDDILLAIGKKYDWKNDRWIKVKLKPINKTSTKSKRHKEDENIIHSSEKHKFSYKIVKLLNKSKSRRNVVVAVSAVR